MRFLSFRRFRSQSCIIVSLFFSSFSDFYLLVFCLDLVRTSEDLAIVEMRSRKIENRRFEYHEAFQSDQLVSGFLIIPGGCKTGRLRTDNFMEVTSLCFHFP